MKTVTEFAAVTLKNAAKTRAELVAAGKTPEELPAALGESLKLEGDKLTRMIAAIDLVESGKGGDLKRVLVVSLAEGEKAPSGVQEKDGAHFLVEFYPPIGGRGGKPGRDEGRGGDRKGGRGGKRGDRKGGGKRGEGRGGDRPRGPRRDAAEGGVQTAGGEGRPPRGERPPRAPRGERPPRPQGEAGGGERPQRTPKPKRDLSPKGAPNIPRIGTDGKVMPAPAPTEAAAAPDASAGDAPSTT